MVHDGIDEFYCSEPGGHGMGEITRHSDYRRALVTMKQRIQTSQSLAVTAANAELLS
jgi:hypothetical protein